MLDIAKYLHPSFLSEGILTCRTDKNLSKAIGKTIAAKRQSAGYTQAQGAEHLGVSDYAISRMESGSIMATKKARLAEFTDLFNCKTTDSLTNSNPTINDEARHAINLLEQLEPSKRAKLIEIIGKLVQWRNINTLTVIMQWVYL